MVTSQFNIIQSQKPRFRENISVWFPDAQCDLVISKPALDPPLWNEYLDGAFRTYSKHGVECTLDLDAIRDGSDTQMFLAMVDTKGHVVGGARIIGPLRSADDSHAVIEWAGNPGVHAVRKMIDDRVPFGVVEVKAAWADSDSHRGGSITTAMARCALPILALMEVQFVMATAAAHVVDRWRSSGGVVASRIPAALYPDDRYRTKMIWWDRSTFANHAEPQQLSRMLAETSKLMSGAETVSGIATATAGALR